MKKGLAPDPERLNGDRARWAETALLAFQRETGTAPEDAVADLLNDLMHLADRRAWHFEIELERAQAHYEIETTPDAGDLLSAAELVIDRWSSGDLAEAVRGLEVAVKCGESDGMMIPRNTIIGDDCIEIMRNLPARRVDFILTDPPYTD